MRHAAAPTVTRGSRSRLQSPTPPRGDGRPDGVAPGPLRRALRRKLLHWYDFHKRDLPWRRRADDPYAQWVAEIMLQQTRVETVIVYYERFLRRFPTVKHLADADHEDVLKHWEGLGYYRRILHLHRAARTVCDNGGVIPDDAEALRALPGVGEYTAAAIASIAFNRPEAAVDGNVSRVLARLFGVTQDVRSPVGKSRIRDLARSLLPRKRPGDFNQAWMDLGSLVCTPKAPRCHACPLRAHCMAAENGDPGLYPVRDAARNQKPKAVSLVVAILVHKGKMLVRRREHGGLWSGLWEFPMVELPAGTRRRCSDQSRERKPPDQSASPAMERRYVQRLASEMGTSISERPKRVAEVRHQLTHRSLRFQVYVSTAWPVDGTTTAITRWVSVRSFRMLAVSTAHRRIFAIVTQGDNFKVRNSKFKERDAHAVWA